MDLNKQQLAADTVNDVSSLWLESAFDTCVEAQDVALASYYDSHDYQQQRNIMNQPKHPIEEFLTNLIEALETADRKQPETGDDLERPSVSIHIIDDPEDEEEVLSVIVLQRCHASARIGRRRTRSGRLLARSVG